MLINRTDEGEHDRHEDHSIADSEDDDAKPHLEEDYEAIGLGEGEDNDG